MRHKRLFSLRALLVAATLVSGNDAWADDAPCGPTPAPLAESLTGEARAEYDSGRLLFENRDWLGAIIKFQSAYDKSHDARLLWNLAASHNQLKHYARTQAFMRRYLSEARCASSPTDRVAAESAIAAAENLIVNVTFNVEPQGAEVFVDGESYGQAPFPSHLRLDTGTRLIEVKKVGFVDHRQSIVLGAEKKVSVKVALAPEKKPGRLYVAAGYGDAIIIDDRISVVHMWEGTLDAGPHRVRVVNASANREPVETTIIVRAGETQRISLATTASKGGIPTWVWIAGGAVVTAGLVVGGYFIFRPGEPTNSVPAGTGGSVQLPSFRW